MARVIKVPRSDVMDELGSIIEGLDIVEGELSDALVDHLFPLLDMDHWIRSLIDLIPGGSVSTFGSIAEALGTKWASRAVGERIASGQVKDPIHRVVYSDGRIPSSSVDRLSSEIEITSKKGVYHIDDLEPLQFDLDNGPLSLLSELQDKMIPLLKEEKDSRIDAIAGMDISSKGELHAAAMSTMEPDGSALEEISLIGAPGIPYVPGLLFYREAPLLLPLIKKAGEKGVVDERTLFVLDGNGVLHPRRMGIACQVGICAGAMTCGVAKKLLVGNPGQRSRELNGSMVRDVMDGEDVIGSVLSKGDTKPVYISRGHRIDQETVNKIISRLSWSRVPEPTKRAHELCNRIRRSETPS